MPDWTLTQRYESSAGEVRWDRLGRPGASPVVLLHGTPFSSYVWRTIAAALAETYEVFVWDMPGYGMSEKSVGQDVSLAAQSRVFVELLEHWGLDQPDVVAHDVGGAVALRATLLHRARYRRLVLVDPVALRPWGGPFFRLARHRARVRRAARGAPRGTRPRAHRPGEQPGFGGSRPRPAPRTMARAGRSAGLLPPDRPGGRAAHR